MLNARWGLTQEGLKQIFELNPKGISHWKQQQVFPEFPNRMEVAVFEK